MTAIPALRPHPGPWWLDARHRDRANLAVLRRRFQSQPLGVLVLDGFLEERLAARVGAFLDGEARYRTVHALYPGEPVPVEVWEGADSEHRLSRDQTLVDADPRSRLGPNVVAFLRLRAALLGPEVLDLLTEISGVPLSGPSGVDVGSVKRMCAGDFIRPHDDVVDGRAVALILHLSRGWHPALGGELELGREIFPEARIATGWNRAVIMRARPGILHGVAAVTAAAGEACRLTINSWYA